MVSPQVKLARAVQHGFRPTGSAKGFSRSFATQVIAEGQKGEKKKHKPGSLGDLGTRKRGE